MSEPPAYYDGKLVLSPIDERIETLAETMAELLVAIENLQGELAAIREAQAQSAEAMRLHGHQLDALTAAIERLGGMLVRAAGGDRLQS